MRERTLLLLHAFEQKADYIVTSCVSVLTETQFFYQKFDEGKFIMTKLIIPAKSFRKFEDPFAQGDQANRPVKYRFYANVADIPEELLNWMNTNPRDQNLDTDTSRAIRASLLDDQTPYFHLWNRGILISAAKVTFDNRKNLAELFLDDEQIHGNIDGGHTLKIILECQEKVKKQELEEMPNQCVEVEVITGLDSPEGLAEARNTSVAVDLKSMEELRKSFHVLKSVLQDCVLENGTKFLDRIEFRQNQMRAAKKAAASAKGTVPENWIDVREVISILNMFNQKMYPNMELQGAQPIQSFSGKEVGLKKFLQGCLDRTADEDECRIARDKLLQQMAPIIPDIFKLWDYIECRFTEATSQINKRYGSRKYSKGVNSRAMLSNESLKYVVPKGIMYPLVGSFRALVRVDEMGEYYWAVNPFQAWEDMKASLATYVMDTSEELANNPANVGRSSNLWSNLFTTLSLYTLQKERS